ncbi:hypothetical protein D3C80_1506950 [compost metagenome]
MYINYHNPKKIVRTPDFINRNTTGKSYLITHDGLNGSYINPIFKNITIFSKAQTVRLNYAFLQQISHLLPSWVIIYISPHEDNGMPAVALQAGKVYFFMRDK